MSATVRISSSFSRSRRLHLLAKSSIVLRSDRSRDCAMVLMSRWCSISQATVRFPRFRPNRGHSLRAIRAGDGMVLRAPLGDVVQEHRDIKHLPVLDRPDQVGGERMVVARIAALDLGQHPDRADQVLVDRVVVVHVELHHRHDLAELRHEAAEHAGLVHLAQDEFPDRCARSAPTGTAGWLPDRRAAAC
jgi:hypothetical protein